MRFNRCSALKTFLVLFIFCSCFISSAQVFDCAGSLPVCGNGDVQLVPSGTGADDFANPNNRDPECGFTESASIWLVLRIQTSGTLGMIITPENNNCFGAGLCDDYDFAVYGPNATCDNLGRSIRCQSTNPGAAGVGGETGMRVDEPPTSFNGGPADTGNGFVRWLDNALVGETYIILVDNFDQRAGFTLTWTGTAILDDELDNSNGGIALGADQTICNANNTVLNATITNGMSYRWSREADNSELSTNAIYNIQAPSSDTYVATAFLEPVV